MQLSNTKLLLTSCCDKLLLTRNSSTTANQHLLKPNLFACRRTPSSIRSQNSNRSTSQFIASRSGLSVQSEQVNLKPHFNAKHYWKVRTSIDFNCKRHFSSNLNINQQPFAIGSPVKNFKSDGKTIEKQQIFNHFSTNSNQTKLDNLLNNQSGDRTQKNLSQHSSTNRTNVDNHRQFNSDQHFEQSSSSFTQRSNSSRIDHPTDRSISQQPIVGQSNYSDLINVRSIYRNNLLNQSDQGNFREMSGIPFKPNKALILTKFSRLEYERRRLVGFSEEEVKESVSKIEKS